MDDKEWTQQNLTQKIQLLKERPKTQHEKDIWGLKIILYSIDKDSLWYRLGIVKTLRRTIKLMESYIPDWLSGNK